MTSADAAPDNARFGVDGFVNGVPAAWKPTHLEPVPVVQCTTIKKDGTRCRKMSLRGLRVCIRHGGQLPNNKAHAAAVVESARMRILENTDLAVDTLENLMQPGTPEAIMLKASTEILDRAGIRGGFEVDVEVTQSADPAAAVRERLLRLQPTRSALAAAEEDDTVDAVLVDEDPTHTQDTLF